MSDKEIQVDYEQQLGAMVEAAAEGQKAIRDQEKKNRAARRVRFVLWKAVRLGLPKRWFTTAGRTKMGKKALRKDRKKERQNRKRGRR